MINDLLKLSKMFVYSLYDLFIVTNEPKCLLMSIGTKVFTVNLKPFIQTRVEECTQRKSISLLLSSGMGVNGSAYCI